MKLAVLVVDDNQDACAMMAKLLRALGYEVDTANDGPSALQLIERKIDEHEGASGNEQGKNIRLLFPPSNDGIVASGHRR